MSLNYKEIALIISELPLDNSLIQRVHQIGFNALIFELYNPSGGFWELYVEIGSTTSRLHRLSGPPREHKNKKTAKLQRFIQYLRAHVEGSKIVSHYQVENDRIVVLQLSKANNTLFLVFRLFSGSAANVIVCDAEMVIKELFYRRPKSNDIPNNKLIIKEPSFVDSKKYKIRTYPSNLSFNQFIESNYNIGKTINLSELDDLVNEKEAKALKALSSRLDATTKNFEKGKNFDQFKNIGDLLSSNIHLIKENQTFITLNDFSENEITIELDPSLKVADNIQKYYSKFKKQREANNRLKKEIALIKANIEETKNYWDTIRREIENSDDLNKKKILLKLQKQTEKITPKDSESIGLTFSSAGFTILVGRNAQENDQLLRKAVRGNDWWMHLRDRSGSYVFIKSQTNKSIPLETILDAAALAMLYSKASKGSKADLYFTQVKYLRRQKGAKLGTVIPTQEKTIVGTLDEERISRLFLTKI